MESSKALSLAPSFANLGARVFYVYFIGSFEGAVSGWDKPIHYSDEWSLGADLLKYPECEENQDKHQIRIIPLRMIGFIVRGNIMIFPLARLT